MGEETIIPASEFFAFPEGHFICSRNNIPNKFLSIRYNRESSLLILLQPDDTKLRIMWDYHGNYNDFVPLDRFGFIKYPIIEIVNNDVTERSASIDYSLEQNMITLDIGNCEQVTSHGPPPNTAYIHNFIKRLWHMAFKGTPQQILLDKFNKMNPNYQDMFFQAYNTPALEIMFLLQDRIVEAVSLENIVPGRDYYVVNYNPAQANFNATVLKMESLSSILSVGNKQDPLTRAPIASIRKVTFTPKPFEGLKRSRSFGGGLKKRSLKKKTLKKRNEKRKV